MTGGGARRAHRGGPRHDTRACSGAFRVFNQRLPESEGCERVREGSVCCVCVCTRVYYPSFAPSQDPVTCSPLTPTPPPILPNAANHYTLHRCAGFTIGLCAYVRSIASSLTLLLPDLIPADSAMPAFSFLSLFPPPFGHVTPCIPPPLVGCRCACRQGRCGRSQRCGILRA